MTLSQSSTRFAALAISAAAIVAALAAVAVPVQAASICPGTTFSTNLKMGATSAAVMQLQEFLNMSAGTQVAASGAGSPGSETDYFGALTKAAVNKFQVQYAAQILTPLGLSTPTGNFYSASQAEANAICAGSTTTTGTGTGSTTGTASGTAVVSAAAQPANTIAPANAARVPFTTFTVTANGAPVTLNSVSVQRQGPSQDTDFSGVVLINASTGVQLGISRVLDANHSATIGSTVVIPAGTSQTFEVAGNIAATGSNSGDIASFAVTAVNTSSTVSGSFPITGASNTINSTLTIGSANIESSSFDPNTSTSEPIGTTGYRFTGFRIQAGSVEDVTFKSITWYESGSASGLQNVMTVVNGTSYPTTLDATGRYYTTVFPTGIVIPKGQSLDVYVQADLGANTTANTLAEFDVERSTDIYLTGNTYGFGITPSSGGSFGNSSGTATYFSGVTTANPYLRGSQVTVTAGTFSTIQNATAVGAQNVAINVPNQPLGGFQTNLTGEAITVQSLPITLTTSSNTAPITNVSLVSSSGQVIAGPYNATCTLSGSVCSSNTQTVTFTGSILFPTGSNTYTIEGQIPGSATNGETIQASTNPSAWTNVTGNTTGNNITIGVQTFTMNTMTVKGATLTVGNSTTPTSQVIVAGGSNVLFAGVQLDASQSGENVRLSSIPVTLTTADSGTEADLSACQLWNGTTALNTGSRVFNGSQGPTGTTGQTFNTGTTTVNNAITYAITLGLDNSLTIPKGTVLNLSLECNLSSSAANGAVYSFSVGSPSASGATSGNTVTPVLAGGVGPVMVASTGATLVASTDSSSPSYTLVAGGTTGVTTNVIKFHATNEGVDLQKVGLTLTNAATSSSSDLTQVYLYAGNNIETTSGTAIAPLTLIGTASFTGNGTVATSTLTNPVMLPNNTDATIIVKADIAQIGTSQPGHEGDLVAIDYLNSQGTGANSGHTIYGTGSGATSAGIRTFKTTVTVAAGPTAVTNPSGTNVTLKNFSVSAATNGSAGLYQVNIALSTSSAAVTNLQLHAYTSGYGTGVANVPGNSNGQFGATITPTFNNGTATFQQNAPLEIGAGSTVYFVLTGNVTQTGSNNTGTVFATLLGDSSYPTGIGANNMGTTAQLVSDSSNFIWSPNATTTSSVTTNDWTNGFGVAGLPSTGL